MDEIWEQSRAIPAHISRQALTADRKAEYR